MLIRFRKSADETIAVDHTAIIYQKEPTSWNGQTPSGYTVGVYALWGRDGVEEHLQKAQWNSGTPTRSQRLLVNKQGFSTSEEADAFIDKQIQIINQTIQSSPTPKTDDLGKLAQALINLGQGQEKLVRATNDSKDILAQQNTNLLEAITEQTKTLSELVTLLRPKPKAEPKPRTSRKKKEPADAT